jgi:hypothetical protein
MDEAAVSGANLLLAREPGQRAQRRELRFDPAHQGVRGRFRETVAAGDDLPPAALGTVDDEVDGSEEQLFGLGAHPRRSSWERAGSARA